MNQEKEYYVTLIRDKYDRVKQIKCHIPVVERVKGTEFYVHCPLLKSIGTSNKSKEEALERHQEDLGLYFSINASKGGIERALLDLGWKKSAGKRFLAAGVERKSIADTINDKDFEVKVA